MKIRLHWSEKYEMVREYPSFELDSQVYNAGSAPEREQALGGLEYKMRMTEVHDRGETIFQMFGPASGPLEDSHLYPASAEVGGLYITEEK